MTILLTEKKISYRRIAQVQTKIGPGQYKIRLCVFRFVDGLRRDFVSRNFITYKNWLGRRGWTILQKDSNGVPSPYPHCKPFARRMDAVEWIRDNA